MPKTCFIIGPIGERGVEIRAHADDVFKYIIEPCEALKELDYDTPTRADMLPDPGRITTQIIELLNTADLVIADLTTNNSNVYYELSLRHALGKCAIHMCLDGTVPSFDIRDNRTIFFTLHARRVEIARVELQRQIARTHEANYEARNPIVDTLGLIQLKQSAQPVGQYLTELINNVEHMNMEIQTINATLKLLTQPDEANYRVRNLRDFMGGRRETVRDAGNYSQPPLPLRSSTVISSGETGLPWSQVTSDAPPTEGGSGSGIEEKSGGSD
jgi:hypothetical protein